MMITLFSVTIITCQQAIGIINRLQQVVGLTYQQKTEIISEVIKVIPNCPVVINTKNK
jgi:hypothetical protein